MKVRVDEIPDAGRALHFHRDQGWFAAVRTEVAAEEISLARPVNVDFELLVEKEQVKVHGQVHTVVNLPCSRCLKQFELEIVDPVDIVLLKPSPEMLAEEVDLRPEDMDTEFFDGVIIDLDAIVAEEIFLNLPQKPLCREECKGLCSGCGADLNQERCTCSGTAAASPFAVLEKLKIGQP